MADSIANIKALDVAYPGWRDDPAYVYCGRRNRRYRVETSPFANPYPINVKAGQDRLTVCQRFDRDFPTWGPKVTALRAYSLTQDLVFVCWCFPELCHCRTFVRLREMWRFEYANSLHVGVTP